MNKKPYEPPVVKKVKLEIKNAILAACNTSSIIDPTGTLGCHVTPRCYVAP
jgi:hypothetical protein